MSLANVAVSTSDFDHIYHHVSTHLPKYRNMHLREACQRNGARDLRYLHALRVVPGDAPAIEGMISGPGVFWHYVLVRTRTKTQLNVLAEVGTPKDLARIETRFLAEIMKRIAQEGASGQPYANYSPGQFYLRRRAPGMSATHPTCRAAVGRRVLDRRFVAVLSPWKLELREG